MMINIAKNSWDAVESEFLGKLGLADDDASNDDAADDSNDDVVLADADSYLPTTAAVPRSGTQPWGRWSHENDGVELDIVLPEGTRAKELTCEVSKAGVLRVSKGDVALISGTLALPVDRTELCWIVEEQDDGSKLLCIEVPMLPIDTSRRRASVDCMFDETLLVNGASCLEPGLSGVSGKAA